MSRTASSYLSRAWSKVSARIEMREPPSLCSSSLSSQFLRSSSSTSMLTTGRARWTSGRITRPRRRGSSLIVISTASAWNMYFSLAQSGLVKVTFSARKRGCTALHMALKSPSMRSSRPVALLSARLIGPLSVERPKVMNSASATRSARMMPPVHLSARIAGSPRQRSPLYLQFGCPCAGPLHRHLLRQDAARGVVLVPLADPLCAQFREDLVEALAAKVEGLGVRPVAQTKHSVAHLGKIRALAL